MKKRWLKVWVLILEEKEAPHVVPPGMIT